jgi:beta-carotene hydroxylase
MSITLPEDLSALPKSELLALERKIARRHSGKFPWLMAIWAFGNLLCWLALWPLVMSGIVPLWLGFIVAVINIALVYLPTHDAQHDIFARKGEKLRWLNELVGHATTWMIVTPFNALRYTHLEHHRHANDPELDPDISTHASGPWSAIWRSLQERQPGGARAQDYMATLDRIGRKDLIGLSLIYQLTYFAILFALAWTGFAAEAFCLWWLPIQLSKIHLDFFLSWAPHNPNLAKGRYRDTRSWKSSVGNLLSMGMQYHTVHHLHPYIPLDRTPAAYREMRPILLARGVETGGR